MVEFYAGGIVYEIRVDDKSGVGIDKAKQGLKGFEQETKKTDTNLKSLSRDTSILGGSLSSLGGTAMIAGTAVGGDLGKGLQSAGMGVAFVGSGITTAVPALKTMDLVTKMNVIPSIWAHIAALNAQRAALLALGSATVIGLVVTGLYLLYQEMEKASSGSRELESNLNKLGDELDTLREVQSVYNYQASRMSDALDKSTDKLKDYRDAIRDARDELDRLYDIEKDLTGMSLDVETAILDEKDVIKEWQEAAARGDKDILRYGLNAAKAAERRKKAEEEYKKAVEDVAKIPEIKGQEKLLEYKENAAEKQRVKDQRELNELKLKQEEIDDRINKKEFQMKLIGWQKEGQGLTKEEYAAFTGEGAPAWMKEAIESMPKTIMQGPQFEQAAVYSAVGAGYGMIPGKGGALPFYQKAVESLQSKEVINPLFKDLVININGTVSNETIRIPASTLKDQTSAQGYTW